MRLAVIAVLALAAAHVASADTWVEDWDDLTGYDRTKLYTISADVQWRRDDVTWTNTLSIGGDALPETNWSVGAYSATSLVRATWMMNSNAMYGLLDIYTNVGYGVTNIYTNWQVGWCYTNELYDGVDAWVVFTNGNTVTTQLMHGVAAGTRQTFYAEEGVQIQIPPSDMMLLDAFRATLERDQARGGIEKNARDVDNGYNHPYFYRGGGGLSRIKTWLAQIIGGYLDTRTNSVSTMFANRTNEVVRWSERSILEAVGAPTNYFAFTPTRDWEGRYTNYPATVQGSWTMQRPMEDALASTNALDVDAWMASTNFPNDFELFLRDGWVLFTPPWPNLWGALMPIAIYTNSPFTNAVIDTCGNYTNIVGTNGQVVAFTCTNAPIQEGFTSADYGFRHFRDIVKLLKYTTPPPEQYASSITYGFSAGQKTIDAGGDDVANVWRDRVSEYPVGWSEWPPETRVVAGGAIVERLHDYFYGGIDLLVLQITLGDLESVSNAIVSRIRVLSAPDNVLDGSAFSPNMTIRPTGAFAVDADVVATNGYSEWQHTFTVTPPFTDSKMPVVYYAADDDGSQTVSPVSCVSVTGRRVTSVGLGVGGDASFYDYLDAVELDEWPAPDYGPAALFIGAPALSVDDIPVPYKSPYYQIGVGDANYIYSDTRYSPLLKRRSLVFEWNFDYD